MTCVAIGLKSVVALYCLIGGTATITNSQACSISVAGCEDSPARANMASALLQVQRKKGTLDHEEDPLQLQILALERGKAKKTLALAEGSRQDGDRLQLGPLNTLEKQKCA